MMGSTTEPFPERVARVRNANALATARARPAAPAVGLETSFRRILAELEMLSHGRTQRYAATVGQSEDGYGRPPGEEFPPHIVWRERWDKAPVEERKTILRHATEELVAHRRRDLAAPVAVETEQEFEDRIVKEGKGWTVEEAARQCRCTVTFVRRARLNGGVNINDGTDIEGDPNTLTLVERARQLNDAGHSERQIAWLTGLPKTTVRRALGRAA